MFRSVHRGWIDLKTAISTNDVGGILSECERGVDSAKKAYHAAMEKPLPDNVMTTITTQSGSIIGAHDRVKALRDAAINNAANSASAK